MEGRRKCEGGGMEYIKLIILEGLTVTINSNIL